MERFAARCGRNLYLKLPDGRIRSAERAVRALLEQAPEDPVLGAPGDPELTPLGGGYLLADGEHEHCWLWLVEDGLLRAVFALSSVAAAHAAVPYGVAGSSPAQLIERALWAFNIGDLGSLAGMVSSEPALSERGGSSSGGPRDVLSVAIANLQHFDDYVIRPVGFEQIDAELIRLEVMVMTRHEHQESWHRRWALCLVRANRIREITVFEDPRDLGEELRRRSGSADQAR